MDVTEAVLTAAYNTLLNDTDLKEAVGPHFEGPYHRTPVDATFPFIVHRLDTTEGLDNATKPATYSVEVWDYGETTNTIWSIREALMALLGLGRITVTNQGTARFWHSNDVWMPNEDRNVMTLTLIFTVRYARAGEVRSIQNQKGS